MKLSTVWLSKWMGQTIDTADLPHQLTMAGLEVDGVAHLAEGLDHIVVAEVMAVSPHPEADRLQICQVSMGKDAPLTIVCGAKNVYAGMKTALAMMGATLPGGMHIKKSTLRGVVSEGMLCSPVELGLAHEADGIIDFPTDAPVGEPVVNYLDLQDTVIDIDLTPNRGDCASMRGLSREVAALNHLEWSDLSVAPVTQAHDDALNVVLSAPEACPRYCGRIIKGVNPEAVVPVWLQERLRRSGLRPISPVVDIMNYVMLELGQPMHAFDLATLTGDITVRRADNNESIRLLDEQTIELHTDDLVIADKNGPLALAGVMGGSDSAVTDKTCDVFLEAAFFDPIGIAYTQRRHGLVSDSAYRFERGVDPAITLTAIERATALLLEIAGGNPGPITQTVSEKHMPTSTTITLRRPRIARILGVEYPDEAVEGLLTRLGLTLSPTTDGWAVTIPSYRFDLRIEEDLLEELVRGFGYDSLVGQTPKGHLVNRTAPESHRDPHRLKQQLVDRGYNEIVTYSFIDDALQQQFPSGFAPEAVPLPLSNPISAEMGVMRTSLWPGLIRTLQHNLHRQQSRLRLFELGMCFWDQKETDLQQDMLLSGVVVGDVAPEQWGQPSQPVDFYDVKGDLEAVLGLLGAGVAHEFVPGTHPALHPGQTAAIVRDTETVGYLGTLHPRLAASLDLPATTILFELQGRALSTRALPWYEPLSKFPSVRRDVAVLVDKSVLLTPLLDSIREIGSNLLKRVRVFDIYVGENIPDGSKSIALGFTLHHSERTLVDDEVNDFINRVMDVLETKFNAKLRD